MTHSRNTPASAVPEPDASRAAPPARRTPERRASAGVGGDDGDLSLGADAESGPEADADDRSARAAAEAMTVRPLRDRRYVVETDGGTYVVALDAGTCTCPDHAIRGFRCKHLRRVAMEVTAGSVPAPDERVGACAVCGAETFVPLDDPGSHLCSRHAFDPGDVVRDRESDERLVVVDVTTDRADAYRTEADRTVDGYATNAAYGAHEPVVEAVYVDAVRPGRGLSDCERYAFPASRLVRPRRN